MKNEGALIVLLFVSLCLNAASVFAWTIVWMTPPGTGVVSANRTVSSYCDTTGEKWAVAQFWAILSTTALGLVVLLLRPRPRTDEPHRYTVATLVLYATISIFLLLQHIFLNVFLNFYNGVQYYWVCEKTSTLVHVEGFFFTYAFMLSITLLMVSFSLSPSRRSGKKPRSDDGASHANEVVVDQAEDDDDGSSSSAHDGTKQD